MFGILFILAGSFSNLIDRIILGYVSDYISFFVWSSFNIADIYNLIGVGFMIVDLIKDWRKK